MPRRRHKQQIVTFKAEASLLDALAGISNRSEFIRAALLAALDSTCPLCKGTGNSDAEPEGTLGRFFGRAPFVGMLRLP